MSALLRLPGNMIFHTCACVFRNRHSYGAPFPARQRSNLHVPPARHHDGLARNVGEQRTGHSQNATRRFRRRARPTQRDIGIRGRPVSFGRATTTLRDAQRDLFAPGSLHKPALLLGRSQPCGDVTKSDGIGPHAKLGTPLLRNGLGEARDAGLGERVVDLAHVAVHARGGRDVDDAARLAVLDAEVGRRGAHEVEGRGAVQRDDGVPLLVGHLVDHAVPGVAGVVDNDVDLAVAEGGGLGDELLDVL